MIRGRAFQRVATGVVVLSIVASACSGNKQASDVSAGGPSASPLSSVAPGSSAAPSATSGSGSHSKSSIGAPATGPVTAGTPQKTTTGFTYKAANLFGPDQDRIGITKDQVSLCMHAALVLGPAFNDSEKDFQVYWQYLNDHGGIYGRKLTMRFTDDAYTPTGGVQAAQQCYSGNAQPFFMMAGVGFDTVPAVREWAEQNKKLYLESFATERGLYSSKYSFEFPPTVEHFGDVAGKYVAKKFPGGNVGVVWRNSPNWQGGRDTFGKRVKAAGSKVTDLPVSQNQGNYTNEILALKRAKATTVLAWVNVLEFVQLEKQAAQQRYFPRWVVAGFNLVTDQVGSDIDGRHGPAAVGIWVTPEFHAGDTSNTPWSAERKVMEAAYAKYDSGHKITDTDWGTWLAFKQTAQFIKDCGQDCTRNKIAGMMQSGYKAKAPGLCDIDFARGRGKVGSFAFNIWKAVPRGNGSGWQQLETCNESF